MFNFEQVFNSLKERTTYFSIPGNSVNYTLAFMKTVKSHACGVAFPTAEIYSSNAESWLRTPQTSKMENFSAIVKNAMPLRCLFHFFPWHI